MRSSPRTAASVLAFVLALAAAAAGCSRNKTAGAQGALQLSPSESGCLTGAGQTMTLYLSGKATAAQIAGVWDCASRSLQLFADRTRGERDGVYTPQELRAFLEKYFLTDSQLSDKLLAEAMELKRTVLGGTSDLLTLEEISRTRQLLSLVRAQTLRLQPYMPLSPEHMAELSEEQVSDATRALVDAAQAISEPLQATGYPYPFQRMSQLLQELEAVAPPGVSINLAKKVRDELPTIQALKAILIEPEGDRIAGNEWALVLTSGARWYSLGLRLSSLGDHYASLSRGAGREAFLAWLLDATGLMREALERRPRKAVPFEELDGALEAIFPRGIDFGNGRRIELQHAKDFLRPVFRRFLGGLVDGRHVRIPGLTTLALDRLEETALRWSQRQRYAEALFAGLAASRASSGAPDYTAFSAADLLSADPATLPIAIGGATAESAFGDAPWRLRGVLQAEKPWFDGEDAELSFEPQAAVPRYGLHDLTEMNWTYEAARALVRGYAEDDSRALIDDDDLRKVGFEEFARGVGDIRQLGVDLRFLDPNDSTQAQKRFREANLFTFSANGDDSVSVREAAELLTLMISAQRLADRIHGGAVKACHEEQSALDPFGYRTVRAQCYRDELFGNIDRYWREFPGMVGYYRGLDQDARAGFRRAMENAARKQGYSPDPMNSTDSQGFAAVAQYIEVIFERYDRDGDGRISWGESEAAFPVFKSALREISCGQGHCLDSDGDLRTVFTYLLKYGQAPSAAQFLWWKAMHGLYSLDADRGSLVRIFANLGSTPHP